MDVDALPIFLTTNDQTILTVFVAPTVCLYVGSPALQPECNRVFLCLNKFV